MKEEERRTKVRKGYAKIALNDKSCCNTAPSCGCNDMATEYSKRMGYTDEELKSVPEGANLGLGCGNPVAIASLKEGETVIDLGSGAGFDCFLAARKVGEKGKVIGVDMTPEMLDKAKANARKGKYHNVEFRLGEIENLPVADNTADIIISNCVINLSPNKQRVFNEAYRTLKPGGRLMVSDMVLLRELPEEIKKLDKTNTSCVTGAMLKNDYLETIKRAGFHQVHIIGETRSSIDDVESDPVAKEAMKESKITKERMETIVNSVASIKVSATKPTR